MHMCAVGNGQEGGATQAEDTKSKGSRAKGIRPAQTAGRWPLGLVDEERSPACQRQEVSRLQGCGAPARRQDGFS